MRLAPKTPLASTSARTFLREFWQRKPLVVRGAFPGFQDPLSADELAGLACETGVDSRLVMQRGARPWQVTRGPYAAKTLRRLPSSHWTLLVESVDRHSKEIAALVSAFSFLPRWRIDDVMVSLAPLGGTVGAHIDSYDVFLIQGQGRRRWQVDSRSTPEYRQGLDLRILKRFDPEDEWILDQGDMLYVPPGVGHRGVTVKSDVPIALTYSVGFRAPGAADLLAAIGGALTGSESPVLFGDRGRPRALHPAEITKRDINGLRRFVLRELKAQNDDAWALAAGESVTACGIARPQPKGPPQSSVAKRLAAGDALSPAIGVRLSWCRLSARRMALFVNGESHVLEPAEAFAAAALCRPLSPSTARRMSARPKLIALVVRLLRHRVLDWAG